MTTAVQSLDRALTLLELIAAEPEGHRLSDLARAAALAVSTTHRLLTTLEQRGFVQTDVATGRWHIGSRAHSVGAAWGTARNLLAPAMPYLRRLRDATRETANLGVIEDGHVITGAQAESREIMRAISPPGGHAPIFCSGMGKAIVATWEDEQIDRLVDLYGLTAATAKSLTGLDTVHAEIARIRAQGYAVSQEDLFEYVVAVGAPVFDDRNRLSGAISVGNITQRYPPERIEEVRDILIEEIGRY